MRTEGYNAIMDEIKADIGANRKMDLDVWGANIEWLFSLAAYMYYWRGEVMEGYTPPSATRFVLDEVLEKHWEVGVLLDLDFEDEDVRNVYAVLYRYDAWLRMAGKDY